MPDTRHSLRLSSEGVLTAAAGKDRWVATFNGEIVNAAAVVGVAPATAPIIVDILLNGVTIFTTTANRPTIAIAGTVSAVTPRPDVTRFVSGDVISLSILQVGTTPAGSDLDVSLQYVA